MVIIASFVLTILLLATVSWPFVFLCVFPWLFGMFDAFREAQVFNLGTADREARALLPRCPLLRCSPRPLLR